MKKWFVFAAVFSMIGSAGQALAAGDAAAGKAKSATCAGCHAADGNSMNPEWPSLAGQHAGYLVKQLKNFKDGDRQNAMMLVNILAQYYQRTLELVAIAANPQTPPAVVEVAKKIADSAGEIIDRTIRTFDQIRDPSTFIIQVEEEIDQAVKIIDECITEEEKDMGL